MNKKLHKQRVRMFLKNKGKYWRIEFRSIRHLNPLLMAAKDAGYTTHNYGVISGDMYTLTMYEDNCLGTYRHRCGIRVPTFTV